MPSCLKAATPDHAGVPYDQVASVRASGLCFDAGPNVVDGSANGQAHLQVGQIGRR